MNGVYDNQTNGTLPLASTSSLEIAAPVNGNLQNAAQSFDEAGHAFELSQYIVSTV